MCEQEKILSTGEYVCFKCGIVLGQEYVYTELTPILVGKIDKNIALLENIPNILDKLNLIPLISRINFMTSLISI